MKQDKTGPKNGSVWKRIWSGSLPLETETTRFILVSVLDIVMTYLAIRYSYEGRTSRFIVEGNPIPAWFFHRWNIQGMIFFKMATVAFVTVIAQIVATKSLGRAKLILNGGATLVGGVVAYTFWLLAGSLL
jgi:hypothetical protein